MDLTNAIAPKSDQLNAEDLLAGPRTVTITKVVEVKGEQPVHVHLAEYPGRPYKPGKSMCRVLAGAWGLDTDPYTGRQLRLYCDPAVKWAGEEVGGIRISHMSHITKPLTFALTVTKGKRNPFTVEPLTGPARPSGPTADQVAACTDLDALKALYDAAHDPEMRAQIRARKAELLATPADLFDGPNIGTAS